MKISPEIQKLQPYRPGKPIEETQREYGVERVYKLASNENPLGPSEKVKSALIEAINDLHRYPDAAFFQLRQDYAKHFKLKPENMTFGNGSNEIIDLLIRVFCAPGESVLSSKNSFVAYPVCSQAARVRYLESPMGSDLKFDLSSMEKIIHEKIESEKIRLVFIANPNNPTGTYVSLEELTQFLDKMKNYKDLLIVLDEAYLEFVRAKDYPNALQFFSQYSNIAVLRTLSKVHGIAGLRLGVLFAQKEIIDWVDRVRNPFNVNSLAQVAALQCLEDAPYIERVQNLNWQGMDYFYHELEAMGLNFWKSQTNFVLIDVAQESSLVFDELLKRGVIVRQTPINGKKTFIRLSVGLEEENRAAISALKDVLTVLN